MVGHALADKGQMARAVLSLVLATLFLYGTGCGETSSARKNIAVPTVVVPSLAAAKAAAKRAIRRDYGPGPIAELHCLAPSRNGTRKCAFLKVPGADGLGVGAAGAYEIRMDLAGRIRVAASSEACLAGVCYFTGGPSGEISNSAPTP